MEKELAEFHSSQASWVWAPRPSSKPPLAGSSQIWRLSRLQSPCSCPWDSLWPRLPLRGLCTPDKRTQAGQSSLGTHKTWTMS